MQPCWSVAHHAARRSGGVSNRARGAIQHSTHRLTLAARGTRSTPAPPAPPPTNSRHAWRRTRARRPPAALPARPGRRPPGARARTASRRGAAWRRRRRDRPAAGPRARPCRRLAARARRGSCAGGTSPCRARAARACDAARAQMTRQAKRRPHLDTRQPGPNRDDVLPGRHGATLPAHRRPAAAIGHDSQYGPTAPPTVANRTWVERPVSRPCAAPWAAR